MKINYDALKNLTETIENVTSRIKEICEERRNSSCTPKIDLDKSGFSFHYDSLNTSQNISLDIGKRLSNFEECSNLQGIVKQSVEGICDIFKNNPLTNRESHSKRKKLELRSNLYNDFDIIEEKEEEPLSKILKSTKNKIGINIVEIANEKHISDQNHLPL